MPAPDLPDLVGEADRMLAAYGETTPTRELVRRLRDAYVEEFIAEDRAQQRLEHAQADKAALVQALDGKVTTLIDRERDTLRAERDEAQAWAELIGQAVVGILGIHEDEVPDQVELLRLAQAAVPRQVETVEQMDALPRDTVIRAERLRGDGRYRFGHYFERRGREWTELDPGDRNDGEETVSTEGVRLLHEGKVVVLWTPEPAL